MAYYRHCYILNTLPVVNKMVECARGENRLVQKGNELDVFPPHS